MGKFLAGFQGNDMANSSLAPVAHYVCGLDIASLTFTACLLKNGEPCGPTTEYANSVAGFKKLEQWLLKNGVPEPGSETWPQISEERPHILMEATGVYWEECALHLHSRGFRVNVVNPAQIKAFGKTTLRRAKTDSTDSDLIARFGSTVSLPLWSPPDLELEALQLIMRQRDALLAMLTEEENRMHALKRRPHVPRSVMMTTEEHIAFLKRKVKDLEGGFKKDIKRFPAWEQSLDLLKSIPGIGEVTAATILTETGNFNAFLNADQVAAYSGIAPAPFTSGTSVQHRTRISKIGNSRLRRALYMAALTAARVASPLRDFYLRLRERGKPAKVALVALARKMLTIAFTIVRSGRHYDPEHCSALPANSVG